MRVFLLGRSRPLRRAQVRLLGVGPGDRVLDLGSGTGTLLLDLARRVGPAGAALGIDPAVEMVRHAQAKARR